MMAVGDRDRARSGRPSIRQPRPSARIAVRRDRPQAMADTVSSMMSTSGGRVAQPTEHRAAPGRVVDTAPTTGLVFTPVARSSL